jgi:hypothetical protein
LDSDVTATGLDAASTVGVGVLRFAAVASGVTEGWLCAGRLYLGVGTMRA